MKPWIHLFKTFDNFYFYDVNKNESIKIEESVYSYLNYMLESREHITFDKNAIEKVDLLKSKGYLQPSKLETIEHPETLNMHAYVTRKLGHLTIQLTQDCNLRCKYCPYTSNNGSNRIHSKKTICFKTIMEALKLLEENSVDNEFVTISFYGGEPLLEFELLVKTVQRAQRIFEGKQIQYTITTNGTIINERICSFFEKNNFLVMVSLDGPKKLNDRNRKFHSSKLSVFDETIDNINYIHKNYPALFENLSINMVIDPTQDLFNYIKFFEQYPLLSELDLNATIVDDDYNINKYEFSEKFVEDFNHSKFLIHLYLMNLLDFKNNKLLKTLFAQQIINLRNLLEPKMKIGRTHCPSGPCIPGKTRLFVNINGLIYPCERISEIIDSNCIGNLENGIDIKKAQEVLNVAKRNYESCKDCFAFRHCTLCVKGHEHRVFGVDKIKEKCKDVRINFHQDLKSHALLKELEIC